MAGSSYLCAITRRKLPRGVGAKAQNLQFLRRRGFRTPETFVVTWDAHSRFRGGDSSVIGALRSELNRRLHPGQPYAVRSSADVEDASDYSFAGQFATLLDVTGSDEILSAITSIWASTGDSAVATYRERTGETDGSVSMAVIVQEMVRPLISGVAFSANPVTGLHETIVEAVQGSGETLVQEGVTPQRWVHRWGAWLEKPEPSSSQEQAGHIPQSLITQVVAETQSIAKAFGRPVDLEWVWDGQDLTWLQLRAITSLDIPVYSNRIAKEVFPGLIRPLVWSVNVPLVNGAWVQLLTELVGPNDLNPQELARCFYYRAYFNMSALGDVFDLLGMPRETLELLLGLEVVGPDKPRFRPGPRTLLLLPRMLSFALSALRFARRVDTFVPSMQERFRAMEVRDLAQLSESELLESVDRLFDLAQKTAYFNILVPVLMHGYNHALRSQLARSGVAPNTFDPAQGMEDLRQFEPSVHLARIRRHVEQLEPGLRGRLRDMSYDEFRSLSGVEHLQEEFQRFLEHFGHLSDSGNDFSTTPWRERPEVILRMVADESFGDTKTEHSQKLADLPLSALRRLLLSPLYNRARRFRWYREAVSSLYTFGYGLFRSYFLALGTSFVERDLLDLPEDIFFLNLNQVRRAVHEHTAGSDYRMRVQETRADMESARDEVPPPIIYGDEALPLRSDTSGQLRGVPASRGHYTGRVKSVQGLHDFAKVTDGDVLVIPYSDVGWTPLFAKAGAVVAESGGLLSHSSIVAREYGIPAVVSVAGATSLRDDTLVTVNGYRGEVCVHDPQSSWDCLEGAPLPVGGDSN